MEIDVKHQLLLTAGDSTTLLREMYLHWKKINRNFSLAYICKKTGIRSKGYLSDVFHGKKKLALRYKVSIGSAFGLDDLESLCLQCLMELDHAKSDEEKSILSTELERRRKVISARNSQLPFSSPDAFHSFELFCTFGLFNGKPTKSQLERYYGEEQKERLESELDYLKKMDLVGQDGEYLFLKDNLVYFKGLEQAIPHIKFLRDAITRAKDNVEIWYRNNEDAYFESSLVSVNEDRYREALQKLRMLVKRFQTDLETKNADRLIRINVQVYPI